MRTNLNKWLQATEARDRLRLSPFGWLAPLLLGLCSTCDLAAQEAPEDVSPPTAAEVQTKVQEWVRTKKLLTEEASAWEAEKATLADLNDLRLDEIRKLDELIAAAGNRLTEAEQRRIDLRAEEAQLRERRKQMEVAVASAEQALRELAPRLPDPLREELGEALGDLEGERTDLPLQNRFRDVLVALGEINDFRDRITVATELRDFADEQIEVEVLYLGLSAAWYVDRSGSRAGQGRPTPEGWVWEEADGLASRVRQAIEVQRQDAPPAFVSLPLPGAVNAETE